MCSAAVDMSEPRLMRLLDGSQVTVRAARATDQPALMTLLGGMRPEALRMRFFTGAVDIAGAAHLEAAVDDNQFGLVAHDATGSLVAHAFYTRLDDPTRAEVAVEVTDHLHGRGLGTLLIQTLATVAEDGGVTDFVAEVLPENHAMLDVFRNGFDAHVRFREGIDQVEFPTSAWRTADAHRSS
jgi:L-amino acid N-acyltransferase YncA